MEVKIDIDDPRYPITLVFAEFRSSREPTLLRRFLDIEQLIAITGGELPLLDYAFENLDQISVRDAAIYFGNIRSRKRHIYLLPAAGERSRRNAPRVGATFSTEYLFSFLERTGGVPSSTF